MPIFWLCPLGQSQGRLGKAGISHLGKKGQTAKGFSHCRLAYIFLPGSTAYEPCFLWKLLSHEQIWVHPNLSVLPQIKHFTWINCRHNSGQTVKASESQTPVYKANKIKQNLCCPSHIILTQHQDASLGGHSIRKEPGAVCEALARSSLATPSTTDELWLVIVTATKYLGTEKFINSCKIRWIEGQVNQS